jgi:hypothetical protein
MEGVRGQNSYQLSMLNITVLKGAIKRCSHINMVQVGVSCPGTLDNSVDSGEIQYTQPSGIRDHLSTSCLHARSEINVQF